MRFTVISLVLMHMLQTKKEISTVNTPDRTQKRENTVDNTVCEKLELFRIQSTTNHIVLVSKNERLL